MLLLLIAPTTLAQQTEQPTPYFTSVIVSDMDIAIQWYTSTLGFKVSNQATMEARGIKQANLEMDGALLELIETRLTLSADSALAANSGKRFVGGFFKVGFRVKHFDNWVQHLEKLSVDFRGDIVRDPITKQRMLIVTDPDGNRIQFFEW